MITSLRVWASHGCADATGHRLVAYASVHLSNAWRVSHIRVIENRDGKRSVEWPSVRNKAGQYQDIAHPLTEAARAEVRAAVLEAVQRGRYSEPRDFREDSCPIP